MPHGRRKSGTSSSQNPSQDQSQARQNQPNETNSGQKTSIPTPAGEQLDLYHREYVKQFQDLPISHVLDQNMSYVQSAFHDCSDFVIRQFEIQKGRRAVAAYVEGLVDDAQVNAALKALMIDEGGPGKTDLLSSKSLPVAKTTHVFNYAEWLTGVLSGDTGIFIDGDEHAILLGLGGSETRSIAEPETEAVVRGPREGYVESIRTNTSLLRRKLKTPQLKTRSVVVGRHSNTNLVVAYMESIADPALVEEVLQRLDKIDIDAVLESGYVEELIQDSTYSPFPQVQHTERPDTTAAALLEGRVAIFVDGTPFVLIVPTTFWQMMQANEDYYERFQMATLVRVLRYLFLIVALTTPALYVAITTYHQAMIPTTLLLSLAAAREAIPFPAVVEALIMEISFEALREAGVRLPKTVGQAVSILGALVVGQAAVEAGIVSAPMVIIVSITGIASFTIPRYNAAIAFRMLRFPLLILASVFGMFGILIGVMFILGHMAKLRSFGVPYLSPTSPLASSDLKDILIRAPWSQMGARPEYLDTQDTQRTDRGMRQELSAQGGQKGKQIEHDHQAGAEEEGS